MSTNEERIKEAFLDMLVQACGEHSRETGEYTYTYDSCCLSSYEYALDLAVEFGWIKKEQVVR